MRFAIFPFACGFGAFLAAAQTFTSCDPLLRLDCPADPAMPAALESDFTRGASAFDGWHVVGGDIDFKPEGASLAIKKRFDYPTLISDTYMFFGYVEAKVKCARGQGIITAIVLQSDTRDEIDFEFAGTQGTNVQTNWYGKGVADYSKRIDYTVDSIYETHTYALNWTSSKIDWMIDGRVVRTLKYENAQGGAPAGTRGGRFPQTPLNVRIGIWAGGDYGNNQGTIDWAGGRTDYSQVPFYFTIVSVKAINYNPGKEYQYTDRSGSWQSIKVVPNDPVLSSSLSSRSSSMSSSATVASEASTMPLTSSDQQQSSTTSSLVPMSSVETTPPSSSAPPSSSLTSMSSSSLTISSSSSALASPSSTTASILQLPKTSGAVTCPSHNNTLYQLENSTKTFLIECGIDRNGGSLVYWAKDFQECLSQCYSVGTWRCIGVSFNSAATGKTKSCYMKSKQEGYSKINVAIWGARMVDAEGKFVVLTNLESTVRGVQQYTQQLPQQAATPLASSLSCAASVTASNRNMT